jgi:hypothetical protein
VTVWCKISSGIVGPYYFEDDVDRAVTVSAERYKVMLGSFLSNELHHSDLPVCFQQMGPLLTPHEEAWQFCTECFHRNSYLTKGTLTSLLSHLVL